MTSLVDGGGAIYQSDARISDVEPLRSGNILYLTTDFRAIEIDLLGNQVGKWYTYTNDGEPFKIYIFNRKGEWIRLKVWNWEKGKWEKSLLY